MSKKLKINNNNNNSSNNNNNKHKSQLNSKKIKKIKL